LYIINLTFDYNCSVKIGGFEMEEMQQVQFALPSPARIFTPAVTVVLILSVAGLLLLIYANDFSRDFLALGPENFIHGRFWQILTYPFLNCPLSLAAVSCGS
jgi:membrane associated rhomboid family serine protease